MRILRAFAARISRIVIGIILLIVSIIGFITPFLPGLPFLVASVMFLCPDSRFAVWVRGRWEKTKIAVRQQNVLNAAEGEKW